MLLRPGLVNPIFLQKTFQMKSASVQEIKQELLELKPSKLTEICLKLAKFKKENKELLTYLLFESHDEANYVAEVKKEIDQLFSEINFSHLYFVKKSLRKVVRILNKHLRYMNSKSAEAELRIYFCKKVKESGIRIDKNTVINNLYNGQIAKARAAVAGLHEDLQYEFLKQLP